ncbi:ATPase [Natronoglycomyces albus]|uniref:ATPase n=1 Tax=Natronoglycomyces albus TaxID=2811108 RepID=A0A895XKJ6_9ACTN|nr:ArsA-related P-loop ATPase [Natronoglycomyces albus]QSB05577.1 ATPase [Natronoglycomyces albus]
MSSDHALRSQRRPSGPPEQPPEARSSPARGTRVRRAAEDTSGFAATDAAESGGSAARQHPVRLHVVTGKGGTGKTTVAAGLALALANGGRRVLLVEVEGRGGIAPMFDAGPLPYEERRLATGADGGEVYGLAIDAEAALLDYLTMFYRLGSAGKALRKLGAIDFATTIAPGLRDVLLTGKVKEAVTRSEGGRYVYDAVVLDAPPTGRVVKFLNVTVESGRLAKSGPIANHSRSVARLLHSPQTAVHLVTLLEEMPVQETLDAAAELESASLRVGRIILNHVHDSSLYGVKMTPARLKKGLRAAGMPHDAQTVAGLLVETERQQQRLGLEQGMRERLDELGQPVVEVPRLATGVDLSDLYGVAQRLRPVVSTPVVSGPVVAEEAPLVEEETTPARLSRSTSAPKTAPATGEGEGDEDAG